MIPDQSQGHGQRGRVAEWQSDFSPVRLSACPPVKTVIKQGTVSQWDASFDLVTYPA